MRLKRLAGLSWVALPLLFMTNACQAAQVHPASQTCTTSHTGIRPVRSAGGHVYEFEADEYSSNARYAVCANGGTGFTVKSSSLNVPLGGAPGAYASEYRGNHGYGAPVSPASGLPVPADKFTWRPGKGVRSVGEVVLHVAGGNYELGALFGVKFEGAEAIERHFWQRARRGLPSPARGGTGGGVRGDPADADHLHRGVALLRPCADGAFPEPPPGGRR